MIATGGGMAVAHPLPEDGVDLRAELVAHQRSRVEQALARAQGDLDLAAKLLRVKPLDLVRLHAGHVAVGSKQQAAKQQATLPLGAKPPATDRPSFPPSARRSAEPGDIPRIERGLEVISRAAIRRLHAEGRTPRQIAARLGVNPFVIEKVLRAEAELAKCGPLPTPERKS